MLYSSRQTFRQNMKIKSSRTPSIRGDELFNVLKDVLFNLITRYTSFESAYSEPSITNNNEAQRHQKENMSSIIRNSDFYFKILTFFM